jgi:hypothetical protein
MSKQENLDFDGLAGDGVNRSGNKWAGNQHGGQAGGNYGMGPRKAGTTGDQAGPSTAAGRELGKRSWEPSAGQNYRGNADKINEGLGPRKGNSK